MKTIQIILFMIILFGIGSSGLWLPLLAHLVYKPKKQRPIDICAECAHWKRYAKYSEYGSCTKKGRNCPTKKTQKCLFNGK